MNFDNLTTAIITPQKAASMLESNYELQRTYKPAKSAVYANDMMAGKWNDSIIDPLIISKDGKLLQGQHRLHAVIMAGVPIKFYIQINADAEVFKYLDCGMPRKSSDFCNKSHAAIRCAVAKMICATKYGDAPLRSAIQGKKKNSHTKSNTVNISRQEILDIANADDPKLDAAVVASDRMRHAMRCGAPTIYAFFYWLVNWIDGDEVLHEFVDDFCELVSQSPTIVAVKQTILRDAADKSVSLSPSKLLAYLLDAYENYKNGTGKVMRFGKEMYLNKYDNLVTLRKMEEQTNE